MAEFAAHLNLNLEHNRPSFFELVAQDSMMSMLKPALKFLLMVVTQRHPGPLAWAIKHHEECYSLITLLVQKHYLQVYDASFAENFYGLKRVQSHETDSQSVEQLKHRPMSLSSSDRRKSLFFLAVLPYLKTKLDALFLKHNAAVRQHAASATAAAASLSPSISVHQDGNQPQPFAQSQSPSSLVRVFTFIYPFVHLTWEASHFVCQMLYLFDETAYYSPELFLAGLRLRRLTAMDVINQQNSLILGEMERAKRLVGPGFIRGFLRFLSNTVNSAIDYSKFVVPITIFFFKFLEWWYDSEHYTIAVSLPVPPAPPMPKIPEQGLALPQDASICPLCLKQRTNPAVVAVSGLVFCYPCIHPYLEQHRCCPVTLLPASTSSLIKIFAGSGGL
ncbi:hypothetical protein CAOG_04617 [Capsaspora owczarzaki ATCC 30864]|uniref:Peroxisome assembly protein 12 n=1 Tax=Capsaspora owczarzaki (strain ATCC 30864) TaxID=595528 RepID=A0A0D2X391_CAPO3|nr:hypothetical protein CAOG_04617 [Capsaspora owczarzaki ATCC 30864]KJE93899.1 hypothetical protein CAOG_004617 [Capsaspora owczarzaki ATCC 30864]|eukprot:XP_004347364.1 hypothetical protein CAOG_04617 [Capsaspora owczarzaki ATCC 30864]